jgi:hypothetical protein
MYHNVQVYEGQYSWLLYGDDDTLFFIDSVSELLQDFDPSLPYVITGMGQQKTLSCGIASYHSRF